MHRSRIRAISLLLGLALHFVLPAAEPIRFQSLKVDDGLSMGTITGVQKDESGYMWIATAEGLHRYDGSRLMVFKHLDGDPASLSDSYIRTLLYHDQHLYIGTNSGTIDVMNVNDHSIRTVVVNDLDPTFDYPVSCLSLLGKELFFGTEGGGLWSVQLDHWQVKRIPSPIRMVHDLDVLNGELLLAGQEGIFSLDSDTYLFDLETYALSLYKGMLIAGTATGAYQRNATGIWLPIPFPKNRRQVHQVSALCANGDELWIGTHGGLLRWVQRSSSNWPEGLLDHYASDPLNPYSLVSDKVNLLFRSEDGVLWVGTLAGLSRYVPHLRKFGLLQAFRLNEEIYDNNVYSVYTEPDGSVWLGTLNSGLIRTTRDEGLTAVFPLIKDGARESSSVRSIFRDSKGRLWIGTRDQGVFWMTKGNLFRWVPARSEMQLGGKQVRCIFEDRRGRIWVGHEHGISYYDESKGGFIRFKAEPDSRTNNATYQIVEDVARNRLVIASFRGGIQYLDLNDFTFRSLKYDPQDSTAISSNNAMCLTWMGTDTLVVGTYGGGFNILDLRTDRFTHFSEREGLVNNSVYGVLNQENKALWLSTNNGIVRFDVKEGGFTSFKPVHYLQSTEYNEGAFAIDDAGWFYFGGVNGLNYFRPGSISFRDEPPPLLVTGIRGEYRVTSNGLELEHSDTRLELDFMALDFGHQDGVRYRYRMNGYDADWVDAGTDRTARYPRLTPGSYIFELEAMDEFGNWKTSYTSSRIVVHPPVWMEWWFVLALISLGVGLLWWVFQFRTRVIKRRFQLQLVDSELSALRSQMNPHFIFNSLNSIQYYILKKEPKEAYSYLSKFASLMRKILQNSRYRYISIADEMEWLGLYLEMESLRLDGELNATMECSGVDDPDHIYVPTMLIQPYVENSIIHGLLPKEGDRTLNIHFQLHEEVLSCVIEDNGIGRVASAELNSKRTHTHRSAGMALTRTRMRILSEGKGRYDVQIEDLYEEGKAVGTRVHMVFPLITAADENVEGQIG